MFGLVLFALASLAGGFATSEGWLIGARAVQGLGAAILSPAALSIVTTTFQDGAERNKALGAWGAVAGSGGAAGVLLGGVLTEYLGWEWVLWVNVPIGIAAAIVAPMLVAESRSESLTRAFDFAGAVSITAGLSVLVYALVDATDAGWGSTQTIVLLAVAAVLIAAFVAIERRSDAPLVPFSIFRLRTLTGANVVGVLTGASLFSMFFFISLYMQQVLDYSAIKAGLSYLPLALTIILTAAVASQLVTRVGFKPVLAAGMVFIAAGLVWFSQVSVGGGFVSDILGPSLLAAAGLGLAFVPQTIAAVSGVAEREAGLASGLINTSQQVGGALGLAVLATIANTRTDDVLARAGGDPSAVPNALTEGFQSAFLAGAGIAVLGLLATLFLIRGRDSRAHVELGAGEPAVESGA
jgi:EmrB/QacA subfamily drug resistance transporter